MNLKKAISGLAITFLLANAGLFFQDQAMGGEETIELKISHHGPVTWPPSADVVAPWAKKIETLSGGKVQFNFFPKEALGKANEQYDLAVKGTADIVIGMTEFTPGRFPLTSCMKLPFMGQSGEQASIVLWYLYQKYLQEEFKETKILWVFCSGFAQLHTVSKEVRTLEDLKGLRLRVPDPALGKAVELLGAVPVVSSVAEGYKLLQEGKVDGVIISWAGAFDFKYLELCKCHTEINIFTLPFFVTMNKARYESLPADIQKIIQDNTSGEEMAIQTGRAMDDQDANAKKVAQKRGDFIYSLPKTELQRWKKITTVVGDQWVQDMKAKGLPGREVLAYVIDFIQLKNK